MSTVAIRSMTNGEYWIVRITDTGTNEILYRHHTTWSAAREAAIDRAEYSEEDILPKTEEECYAAPRCPADPTIRVFFQGREPIVSDLVVKRWAVEIAESYHNEALPIASGLSFRDAYRLANDRMKQELGDVDINLPAHLLIRLLGRGPKIRGRPSLRKRGG